MLEDYPKDASNTYHSLFMRSFDVQHRLSLTVKASLLCLQNSTRKLLTRRRSVAYLENGYYCPEKVVEVLSVTFARCRDSLRRDNNWIFLTEFASEKIHSKNTKITPNEIILHCQYVTTVSTSLRLILKTASKVIWHQATSLPSCQSMRKILDVGGQSVR